MSRVETLRGELAAIRERKLQLLEISPGDGFSPGMLAMGAAEYDRMAIVKELEIKRAELDVEDGLERDQLQAERPEGCFCFGLGGRGALVRITPTVDRWLDPCEACPEGRAMLATAQAASDQLEAEITAAEAAIEAQQLAIITAKRIELSGITPRARGYSLAEFPGDRSSADPIIRRLLAYTERPDSLEASRSAYLYGLVGRGKTILGQLALLAYIEAGRDGYSFQLAEWLDRLRESYGPSSTAESGREMMRRARTAPLLVVDDLGTERLTEWAVERLFIIVNERYERRLPTIWTSNQNVGQTGKRITEKDADPIKAERIIDRIFETCDQLHLQGPNLRGSKTS